MTKPELYKEVILVRDVPADNLKKGDIGWLLDYLPHPADGEEGAILEIFDDSGASRIVTVKISAIQSLPEPATSQLQ